MMHNTCLPFQVWNDNVFVVFYFGVLSLEVIFLRQGCKCGEVYLFITPFFHLSVTHSIILCVKCILVSQQVKNFYLTTMISNRTLSCSDKGSVHIMCLLFLYKNMLWYILEAPQRGTINEYPEYVFEEK